MWTRLKLIIVLIFVGTVFDHVKCEDKIPKKTFLPVITSEKPFVTHTHTYHIIQWETVDVTDKITNNTNAEVDKITTEATAKFQRVYNVSLITWEAAETASPAETSTAATNPNISTTSTTPVECLHFKPVETPFNLDKMADIWQTVYYQLPDKVQCFKIHIKKISDEERTDAEKLYGTFDAKVNWSQIFLEIMALTNIGRKHFLQLAGDNDSKGLLRNVIIVKENNDHVLHEESADQWLVFQKLLLMRDCETGGIVVFSKVPHLPLQQDIKKALQEFGSDYGDGKPACDEDEPVNRYYEAEEEALENFK